MKSKTTRKTDLISGLLIVVAFFVFLFLLPKDQVNIAAGNAGLLLFSLLMIIPIIIIIIVIYYVPMFIVTHQIWINYGHNKLPSLQFKERLEYVFNYTNNIRDKTLVCRC
ncbi:MAG: hypothetical protein ACVCEJ_06355 [Candidatus Izemoplasmataceae bacterium]